MSAIDTLLEHNAAYAADFRCGELEPAPDPLYEGDPQLILEGGDLAPDGRLGTAQSPGSGRVRTLLGGLDGAHAGEVVGRAVEPGGIFADLSSGELRISGPKVAQGDVGLALAEVANLGRCDQLDLDTGVQLADPSEDRG